MAGQSSWGQIDRERTIAFLKSGLNVLPAFAAKEENNRLSLIYFVISSLDVLDALDVIKDKQSVIDYIYNLQLIPEKEEDARFSGFRGSPFIGIPWNHDETTNLKYDYSSIAMTYVALALLKMLGDDFGRVKRKEIINALRYLQQPDGSFSPVAIPGEHDMRFVFCACAISYMLNDWSGVNVDKMVEFILASQSYEAAFGQNPGTEGHGGSTFCALASLTLCGRLNDLPRKDELIKWLVDRQVSGFQGRPNKDADTCYSFWVGGSLDLLGAGSLINSSLNKAFTLSCQTKYGGFSKVPGVNPDVLHTYYGLCGLSLQGHEGLQPLFSPLSITKRAAETKSVFDDK